MFPDSPFAVPRGSFERPVPLVLVDPCDDPSITVKINRAWVPYVLGALQQLVLQSTWDTNDPDALWLVQQRAMSLLSCVVQAYDNPECEPGCMSYPFDASIISWQPTDPFVDPAFVPPGYRFPSWFIATDSVIFPGVRPGDMITDLLHGPIVEPLSAGFPRFRITCNGTGTVEVEFVRFDTAGVALITVDGDVTTAKFVDLHLSLAASVGSAESEMIIPIEITVDGPHVIDVSMLFSITEDPPFVQFGGGIRKIELCGFGVAPDPAPVTRFIEEWTDDVSLCDNIKFEDGILKVLCCGQWVAVDGQSGGLPPSGAQPGQTPRPAYGQSTCFNVSLQGNNQWQLPMSVRDGDVITITDVKGAWWDGAVSPWYCPNGGSFVLGVCIGGGGPSGGDPASGINHMRLVYSVGSVWYDGYNTTETLPGGTGNQVLTLQANDADLGDNKGNVTFKICVTNGTTPPAATWCSTFDFTVSDGGFTAFVSGVTPLATYYAGQGWGNPSDPSVWGMQLLTPAAPPDTVFTRCVIELNSFPTSDSDPHAYVYEADNATLLVTIHAAQQIYDMSFGPYTASQIDPIYSPHNSAGPGTPYFITRITLYGNGTNPFGADNC